MMADIIDFKGNIGWLSKLARSNGAVLPTISNAMLILANDPALHGLLGYDEFVSTHFLMRAPPVQGEGDIALPGPYPRTWGTEDVAMLQAYLQAAYTHKLVRSTLEDAMVAESSLRRFHPVRDWLATLVWDGTRRIDKWLSYAFGCEDNSYHRAIGSKLLIAAVRRVRQPGVKFDHLPVFEGLQGIGKSRSVRALFGAHWFSDAMPNDLASRESPMALQGRWCMEFSEIDALIRTEIETVKAFLSRQVDRYRPMYGRNYVERPRQCVLIGTTNSRDYLRDSTGNRRIWPVYCTVAAPAWLDENRDQIWAEAAHRELSGEAIWLDDIEVREGAERAQAERRTEDVWSIAIAEWLIGRTEFATHEILSGPLQIPRERQDRRAQIRVASILRELGWESVIRWDRGQQGAIRVWQRDKQADAAGTLL